MPERKIEVIEYECLRCGHRWLRREDKDALRPLRCAHCKSPYWDTPRRTHERPKSSKAQPSATEANATVMTATGPMAFPKDKWKRKTKVDSNV